MGESRGMQATLTSPLPFLGSPTAQAPVALARGRLLRIEGECSEGVEIRCCAGVLWITCEGEPGDVVLAAGERFVVGRGGLVLIEALEAASLVCH